MVTTMATGAADSVVDGVTGSVVPVGDALALAAALEKVLQKTSGMRWALPAGSGSVAIWAMKLC